MSALPELIFWPGSLPGGYTATLQAAQAGQFTAVAVSPLTIRQLLDSGHDSAAIRAEAGRHGVRLAQLDGATSWAPARYAGHMPDALKARFDFSGTQVLDLATAAGMDSILAAGAFDPGTFPVDDLAASFAAFCDQAAGRSLRVELEFVPFWGIRDLATAWEIVRTADRPNGTLMIDSWHLLKGSADPAAALKLLAEIPGDKLTGLQLADALQASQADTVYAEGRLRRFPGQGELPLADLTRTLIAKRGLIRVGAEVFGEAIDALSPRQAGRAAATTTTRILAAASRAIANAPQAATSTALRCPACRRGRAFRARWAMSLRRFR
jgi:sugar phosphate isomerase/epimerase